MSTTRRQFLMGGLAGAIGLSLRASATGLPASFLTQQKMSMMSNNARFSIISCSNQGESLNANGPGTYGNSAVASRVEHVRATENEVSVNINGQAYTAADLENSAPFWADQNSPLAARCYEALNPSFKENLSWFNHQTLTSIHPEFGSVMFGHGSVRNNLGLGQEMIPAAIAQETADLLGTTLNAPINLTRLVQKSNGSPLVGYRPLDLKRTLLGSGSGDLDRFDTLFNAAVDDIYQEVKNNGNAAAKRFLDNHALTAQQAKDIGSQLGDLVSDINDNSITSQLKMALALVKLKVSPVVTVQHQFSGDNHNDRDLSDETTRTLEMINHLNFYWSQVQNYQLENDVCYATVDVFGRTTERNNANGRNHYGVFSSGMLHCHGVTQGRIIGGMELDNRNRVIASGINSQTGDNQNVDISANDTLDAYFKTMMATAGVSTERCDVRIPSGKIVEATFSSSVV